MESGSELSKTVSIWLWLVQLIPKVSTKGVKIRIYCRDMLFIVIKLKQPVFNENIGTGA
jgi:hypothetical protein